MARRKYALTKVDAEMFLPKNIFYNLSKMPLFQKILSVLLFHTLLSGKMLKI